jgi:hypothetical protein
VAACSARTARYSSKSFSSAIMSANVSESGLPPAVSEILNPIPRTANYNKGRSALLIEVISVWIAGGRNDT